MSGRSFRLLQLLFLLFLYELVIAAQYSKQFAGPYDMIVKQAADCEESGTRQFVIESNKLVRFNRSLLLYSTNVTLELTISDTNTKVVLNLAIFGNGGWLKNYFTYELGAPCTSMYYFQPQTAKFVFGQMGIEGCPVPPGNYTIRNLKVYLDGKGIVIPYNKYRADFNFHREGQLIGCKRLFFDVVPKSGGKKKNQ